MRKQIDPNFSDASKLLSDVNETMADWTTLYKVMLKYLLSSFRNLLEVSLLLLC